MAVLQNFSCRAYIWPQIPFAGALPPLKFNEAGNTVKRRRVLKRVDRELSNYNFKTALSLVKQLQGQPGGLRGFGAAKQVPKKLSLLGEPEINGVDISSLHPLVDLVLDSIRRCVEFSLLDEESLKNLASLSSNDESNESQIQYEQDHFMYVQHEAGHFLVAYLLGVLPKEYKIPSIHALRQNQFAVGRIEFVGFDFLEQVFSEPVLDKNRNVRHDKITKGKITFKTLNRFLCVILGGLVAEHLIFGYSEGLHGDVETSEADLQVKWAALNTVYILNRHLETRSKLAEAMARGRSVGFCIDTIENALHGKEI